jgi:hypothetical protein
MKKYLYVCLAALFLAPGATDVAAQTITFHPERTLSRVQKSNFIPGHLTIEAATTWCMDRGTCKYHLGPYHFDASIASQVPTIRSQRIVHSYSPATPGDPEAISLPDPFQRLQLINPRLDFVIYEVEKPLAKEGMEGVDFYPYQLKPGDEATLYGYVGIRGKLVKVPGHFTTEFENGILEFRMEKPKGVNWPGASGGLILDAENRAIGLVTEAKGDIVQAIPVWAIADFLWHEKRDLYRQLFPNPNELYQPAWASAMSGTANEKAEIWTETEVLTLEHRAEEGSIKDTAPRPFLPERYLKSHEPIPPVVFPRHEPGKREEEPTDTRRARDQANAMLDRSKNLILGEDVWFGGDREREVEARYEVRVVDGRPTVRLLKDGEQEKFHVAYSPSRTGVAPGDAWMEMPALIASKMHDLPMLPAPDRTVGGITFKVFRFAAKLEDNACIFHSKYLFERVVPVSCEGEVWFTEEFEIVRMEERFRPPKRTGWGPWDVVVSYGLSPNPPVSSAEGMLPATIYVEAELLNGRKYHCFARVTKVSGFGVSSRIDRSLSN